MKQDTDNSAAGSGATYQQPPPRTSPRVEPKFASAPGTPSNEPLSWSRKTTTAGGTVQTTSSTWGTTATATATSATANHNSSHNVPDDNDHDHSHDKPKIGESTFLTRESEQAKKAMSVAFTQSLKDLGRGVDPRAWTASHPWIALATAAVGGFVAATQLVPTKDEQLLKKLERIREAVMPEIMKKTQTEREREAAAEQLDNDGKPQKAKGRGFFSVIGTELIKYLAPALSSALSAAIAGHSVADSAQDAENAAAAAAQPNVDDPAASI